MAKGLTEVALKAFLPREKRYEAPDGKVAGLHLIVQPSGARSWAWRFRFAGKPRKLTLGSYPELGLAAARALAQEAAVKLARGIDPGVEKIALKAAARAEKVCEVDLVENVVKQFLERHAMVKTRDHVETKRLLEKDVVGRWKGRRLSSITRGDVRDMLDAIVDRGAPVGANRTFAQLRKMCAWSVERGIIDRSPCDGVKPPSSEQSRDRVLDDNELRLLWHAAGEIGFPFGSITRLLMLTGARKSEIGDLVWSEIDLEKAIWRLPAERSKNRRAHEMPLSKEVVAILKSLPRFTRKKGEVDYIFSPGTTAPSGFSRAKTRLDAAMLAAMRKTAIDRGADPDEEVFPAWIFHDIRRSVASGMAATGVDLHVIEKCMNHVSGTFGGIVAIYQRHTFADEMREAMNKWGSHIDAIID
jgi:integrase